MLPRSHNLRQISDMHFGVTSDIHNCFDISHNKSAGARRRPTRIAVWVWVWEWKVKSGDHTEWSYSIEWLWVGGFSYLLWSSVAFEQDSAGVARQQRAKLTLCLTFVILRSLIIFELSYKGAEPHRSHTAPNSKDHTFDKCSAWFPLPPFPSPCSCCLVFCVSPLSVRSLLFFCGIRGMCCDSCNLLPCSTTLSSSAWLLR